MSNSAQPRRPYRVAFISRNPSQWEGPFYARIAALSAIQPHVYYLSPVGLGVEREAEMGAIPDWGSLPVLEGYDHSFVEPSWRGSLTLIRELASRQHDAIVVAGYRQLPLFLAIFYAVLSRKPRFLRVDSILMYEREKPTWKFKQGLFPWFQRLFTAFLPLSSLTVQYLQHLGVSCERIFMAPYTVDNEWYARLAQEWRPRRQEVRAELSLPPDVPVVVAVLRFVERERPLDLLRAIEVLQRRNVSIATILVGDGPQRAKLVDFIHRSNLKWVVLPGFRPLSDLPRFYAVSDMFVHPAVDECWGLSVNEAMACGLPVIASDRVGASYDLVKPDQTGVTYRAGDIDELAARIEQLAQDQEKRKQMGLQARDLIFETWGYEKSVSALQSALACFVRQQCQA